MIQNTHSHTHIYIYIYMCVCVCVLSLRIYVDFLLFSAFLSTLHFFLQIFPRRVSSISKTVGKISFHFFLLIKVNIKKNMKK